MNRANGQRGAIAVLALVVTWFVVLGGIATTVTVAAGAAGAHANAAADAAAHAAVATLAADGGRDDFEAALQAGATCSAATDARTGVETRNGDSNDSCRAALDAARSAAGRNGARLINITVGPDTRAYVDGAEPALFEVLTYSEVPGPLDGFTALCADHQSRDDFCWGDAWSGARESG